MNRIRMNWLDAARIAAAFCIIAIHSTTDVRGLPFPDAQAGERVFTILFRTTAELASTEYFFLISLFLLAFKLERKPAGFASTMKMQARRLLVPFVFWTVFYAFFHFIKAYKFDYVDSVTEGLLNPTIWIDYFILGTAQYHMHFLPTLFILILFHPLYKLAAKFPILGLSLIPMIFLRNYFDGWLWGNAGDSTALEYLLQVVKILCYVGYGMAAYAMFGLWKTQIDPDTSAKIFGFAAFSISLLFLIKLIQANGIIDLGDFGVRKGINYYAHYLIPVFSLTLFMSSQHFNWPDKLSLWSKYTFAMYLVHPAVIDAFDVLIYGTKLPIYQYTTLKFLTAASGSLGIALLISKISWLSWTIGLGPLPFTAAYRKAYGKQQVENTVVLSGESIKT